MFIRLECAVEQFFVVFRLDSVSCYVSYSNEWFNLLGRSVTNLLYQNSLVYYINKSLNRSKCLIYKSNCSGFNHIFVGIIFSLFLINKKDSTNISLCYLNI